MRTSHISALALVLLLAQAGGVSFAAPPEETPLSERQVLTWQQWQTRLHEIRTNGATTAKQYMLLRSAARTCLVVETAKVLDTHPVSRKGVESVEIQLCGRYGAELTERLVIAAADTATAIEWDRWDRISWKSRISVSPNLSVSYERIFDSIADLVHEPNPGIEYPLLDRPVETADAWRAWIRSFAESHVDLRTDATRALVAKASTVYYAIPAAIEAVQRGRILVRLRGKLSVTDRASQWKTGVDGYEHWFTITDPQVLDAVKVGGDVVVLLSVGETDANDFTLSYEFWTLK